MTLFALAILAAQLLLLAAMGCALYRVLGGPRARDRILGLDALYTAAMLLALAQGIRSGQALFFDVALLIAALGFVSTVALAKFLLRGEVVE